MAFGAPESGDGVQRLALALGIVFVTALVAFQAFEACAVLLDDDGVECVRLIAGKQFFVRERLQWKDVERVSTDQNAFVLSGAGLEIRIRPMVFSEPQRVVAYIQARQPRPPADKPVSSQS